MSVPPAATRAKRKSCMLVFVHHLVTLIRAKKKCSI
jgi:hypothetical protein